MTIFSNFIPNYKTCHNGILSDFDTDNMTLTRFIEKSFLTTKNTK